MGIDSDQRACGTCGETIAEGQAMKAKDSLYHQETCFKCATCLKVKKK